MPSDQPSPRQPEEGATRPRRQYFWLLTACFYSLAPWVIHLDLFVLLATLWALAAIVAMVLVLKEKAFDFKWRTLLIVTIVFCSLLGRRELSIHREQQLRQLDRRISAIGGDTIWVGLWVESNITSVHFGGSRIDDAVLERLGDIIELEGGRGKRIPRLELHNTRATDAGLQNLTGWTNLQALDLTGTWVTDEGVKMLEQSLPNCKITKQPLTGRSPWCPWCESSGNRLTASFTGSAGDRQASGFEKLTRQP